MYMELPEPESDSSSERGVLLKRAKSSSNFIPREPSDLGCVAGSVVTVTNIIGEWAEAEQEGRKGIIPVSY